MSNSFWLPYGTRVCLVSVRWTWSCRALKWFELVCFSPSFLWLISSVRGSDSRKNWGILLSSSYAPLHPILHSYVRLFLFSIFLCKRKWRLLFLSLQLIYLHSSRLSARASQVLSAFFHWSKSLLQNPLAADLYYFFSSSMLRTIGRELLAVFFALTWAHSVEKYTQKSNFRIYFGPLW